MQHNIYKITLSIIVLWEARYISKQFFVHNILGIEVNKWCPNFRKSVAIQNFIINFLKDSQWVALAPPIGARVSMIIICHITWVILSRESVSFLNTLVLC